GVSGSTPGNLYIVLHVKPAETTTMAPLPPQVQPEATSLIVPAAFDSKPEDNVPAVWKIGDVILGRFKVIGILGEGGMGTVYKIHYNDWKIEMAVKSPRSEIFAKAGGKENFIREAET